MKRQGIKVLGALLLITTTLSCTKSAKYQSGGSPAVAAAISLYSNQLTQVFPEQATMTDWLNKVKKPCINRIGRPHPDQGTGICTGNLYTTVPIGNTGLYITNNSLASYIQIGFGKGWMLSMDRRFVVMSANSKAILIEGDGTMVEYVYNATSATWISKDPRISLNKIKASSDGSYIEYADPVTRYTYKPISTNPNEFALSSISNLYGPVATVTRNADSQIETITGRWGRTTRITYSTGLATAVTDYAGNQYQFSYSNDKLMRILAPNNVPWSFEYIPYNGLISVLNKPGGEKLEYTYFTNGVLRSIKNQWGYVTAIDYGPSTAGVRTSESEDVESFTGGVLTSKSSRGAITTVNRDSLNRVISIVDPLGRSQTFTYSGNSVLPSTSTGPNGYSATYTYNADNVLTRMTETQGNARSAVNFTAYRLVTARSVGAAVTRYAYDSKGNVTQVSLNNVVQDRYGYDGEGNMVSHTDRFGLTTTYAYDKGLVVSVVSPIGKRVDYTRDALGNATKTITPPVQATQEFTSIGEMLGKSLVTAGSTGTFGGNTSLSRHGNGAPSFFSQSSEVSGVPQITTNIQYAGPDQPGNIVSRTIINSRGETFNPDN